MEKSITNEMLVAARKGDKLVINNLINKICTNKDGTNKIDCLYYKYSRFLEKDDVQYYFDYHFSKTINKVWWQREDRKPSLFGRFIWSLVMKAIIMQFNNKFGRKIRIEFRGDYLGIKHGVGCLDFHESEQFVGGYIDDSFDKIDAFMRISAMRRVVFKERHKNILLAVFNGFNVREMAEENGTTAQTIRNDIGYLISLAHKF